MLTTKQHPLRVLRESAALLQVEVSRLTGVSTTRLILAENWCGNLTQLEEHEIHAAILYASSRANGKVKKKRPSGKKPDPKAPKRRRFVAGLLDGKSMRRAALDAGYTESMSDNAGRTILPGARKEFQQALTGKISQAKLIQRIVEGLNPIKVSHAELGGTCTAQR